ncbi:uncharacterized protein LOC132561950 [Ylistrum balloti]|uniref:uncharacterized protein LOC132561950 n=1 Tax=Ylistrum balloti TaxID=509963 RepID=UPI0029057FE8|nr:uncharacterized protein LOC132561950 [Ylistrum balloti]
MCRSGHGAMLRIHLHILRILLFLLFSSTVVSSIRCYECENGVNPACGKYFKAYQFKAKKCGDGSPYYKCALQRQTESDGYVGIARVCYEMGTLYGLNETDGCREWTNEIGFTALYCFCSTNLCNKGNNPSLDNLLVMTSALALVYSFLFH